MAKARARRKPDAAVTFKIKRVQSAVFGGVRTRVTGTVQIEGEIIASAESEAATRALAIRQTLSALAEAIGR